MTLLPWNPAARLEGERVLLRPVQRDDAPAAFELIHDKQEILRWLLWRGPQGVGELEERFSAWAQVHDGTTDYLFAIVERETSDFVGTIGVRFSGGEQNGDLGYWLGEHVWGLGYMTEAIRLACSFSFDHLGAASLFAWVFVGNDASRRALENCGFSLVRTELARMEQDGVERDEWYLVLLQAEWERRKRDKGIGAERR